MWKYFLPTKIFAGVEIIVQNAGLLGEVGTSAFLVTGKSSAKKCGALDEVQSVLKGLDIQNEVFDEVEENPSFATIEKGGRRLSASGCDFVIAIGGGSPLDAAKAISVIGRNSGSNCRDLYKGQHLPAFPIITVPTTSGTGSEVTPYSILTDGEGTKKGFGMPSTFPYISYLDPRYTVTMPTDVTVATALDALSHSVEGEAVNNGRNPLVKMLSRKATGIIKELLGKVLMNEDNVSLRGEIQYAATIAGIVIAHTGTTAVHAAGYPLSSFKGVKHGMANALMLIKIFRRIANADPERIASAIEPFENLDELKAFLKKFGVERIDLRISDEEIENWSEKTAKAPHLKKTPGDFDKQFFAQLYREIKNH
ncbi:MAG TPA: iron-containing alcohol dehydrogenase [Mesotoga infera]|uniref:Iron-containing alcohol dehydrogenase n=1 Tax=Mesotoga infera TaxID=1236046 RepID=A0A7C1CY79_9BACT|nr:iron-containing alcohol dehydrogenase [Mesotoga infera]